MLLCSTARNKNENSGVRKLVWESSAQLTEHIVCVLEEAKLKGKVVSLSADNTNANFGGAKRRGKNNVFERLRNKIKRDIIGVGCAAHIVHNAMQTAAACLPMDIESIVSRYICISTFVLCMFKH
jgi:hypothetical protein